MGNQVKRRTSSDKDNAKPRLIPLEEDDQSNKISQKLGNNCKDPLSVSTSEQPNSIKCLEKQKKELISGSDELCDLKMTHFGQDSNSKDDGIAKEKCDDLTNVVLETEITHPLSEKEGSEKMLSHNRGGISKISHPPKSMGEVQEEGSTMNHDEYDSKGKSVEKNVKSSDKCISRGICEKSSSLVASVINASVLKESQPTQFAGKPAKDMTNDEHDLKPKVLKKTLKNRESHFRKDKQLGGPFRMVENKSPSSEKEGPKEVLFSKHDIASKELNATRPSRKGQGLPSVSGKEEPKEVLLSRHGVAFKELNATRPLKKGEVLTSVTNDGVGLKRKTIPQDVKSKGDHHINAEKSKQSAKAVRPTEDTMNLNGSSEMLASNPDIVLKVSTCIKSEFRPSKLPSTCNENDLKKKHDGKTINCKATLLDSEKCKKLNSSVKALENRPRSVEKGCATEMLRNHDSIPEKTYLAKSTVKAPGRSIEKVPGEVLITGDDQDLKEKCSGKNQKYTNVCITGGPYKHFPSPARVVGNTLPSCEKVSFGEMLSSNLCSGSKESLPLKPVEKPDKEVCNNDERHSKPKYLKKTTKNKNALIGDEKRKQLVNPVKVVEKIIPLVERAVGPKEMLSSNQESFSKASQGARSVERASKNLISPSSSEGDLKGKRLTLNPKMKDDCYKSVEKSKQPVSSVGSVETTLGVDVDSTDRCIEQKDRSKHIQPNVEKLRHVTKMHDVPKVTSSQAKFQQDVVSTTRSESDCKDTFKVHRQKSKNAPVKCEDTQQSSKIEKGSRRVSKTMARLSSEEEVSTTKQDEVASDEISAVSNVKKSFIGINTKSQQILAPSEELEKTAATSEKDIILVASSVIEKTGGSCISSNHNGSSAIEADNIDQLMSKYEILMNRVKAKAIGEKKSDKRLSQKKILNIFGEEHLAEDSESILNTPVFNIRDIGRAELSKSKGGDGPLEKRENSGSTVTSKLNVETVIRKMKNNVEDVGKKRKLGDSVIIKRRKKSRRHSVDVPSHNIKTEKRPLVRERASFDCLDSNIGDSSNRNFSVISTTCDEIPLGNEQSKANNGAALKRCISHSPETLHLTSSQGSSEERHGEAMRNNTGVDGLQATKHSPTNLLSKITNVKEEVSLHQNENSIDEDPDIIVIDSHHSVKKEMGTCMDEEDVLTDCSTLDRVSVSSPVSLTNPEYSDMEISAEELCISLERLDEDDLLIGDSKPWNEFEIQQKLQQLEDVYKRKEKEIHRVKAMKEKVFRVWEKFCGIELVEKEAVKKEVNSQDNLPSPLIQEPEVVTIDDVKEEIDEGSSVSTEILETSDDFEIQQQQVELEGSHDAEIVSSSGTSAVGSTCSQESSITGASAGGKELDVVSSSAIEKSSMPCKRNHNVQLTTGGNCDDISGIHQFNSQEPQMSSVGMPVAAKAMISGPGRADVSSEMRNVGLESNDNVPEPRGDRIRFRE
ncbi:uncharacterized protein [Hetaerina americana]|uniref:uncharacterized protein n=1 Tax=Hetaerina americana TaxID=62018 RepID=UPI003A7F1B0E